MGYRKLTEEERAQRRRADRERVEQAARALLDSEGWRRWVKVRASNGLARYSFHNQLLIALQRPDATYVAGFRAFVKLNRVVRKGEKAIRIWAPMSVRRKDGAATAEGAVAAEDERRTVFRAVSVFDASQTRVMDGLEPVPLEAPSEPIDGDSHAHLIAPLRALAGELGYAVCVRSVDGAAQGWCDSGRKEIVVSEALAANAQVRVLVHELAHALGIGYREHGRAWAEVIVDTVTFIVCGSVGLHTSGSTVPYLAGWGEDGDLEAIRSCAQSIDQIARRIEDALRADAAPAPPKPI